MLRGECKKIMHNRTKKHLSSWKVHILRKGLRALPVLFLRLMKKEYAPGEDAMNMPELVAKTRTVRRFQEPERCAGFKKTAL